MIFSALQIDIAGIAFKWSYKTHIAYPVCIHIYALDTANVDIDRERERKSLFEKSLLSHFMPLKYAEHIKL